LPELIANLPTQKVYQTAAERNYVYAVTLEIDAKIYEIYFMLQRADGTKGMDLRLTVESAYVPDEASEQFRGGKARFAILALKTLRREKIDFSHR
jgi:hypothetical protein